MGQDNGGDCLSGEAVQKRGAQLAQPPGNDPPAAGIRAFFVSLAQ
jgi:hypothetical protein